MIEIDNQCNRKLIITCIPREEKKEKEIIVLLQNSTIRNSTITMIINIAF